MDFHFSAGGKPYLCSWQLLRDALRIQRIRAACAGLLFHQPDVGGQMVHAQQVLLDFPERGGFSSYFVFTCSKGNGRIGGELRHQILAIDNAVICRHGSVECRRDEMVAGARARIGVSDWDSTWRVDRHIRDEQRRQRAPKAVSAHRHRGRGAGGEVGLNRRDRGSCPGRFIGPLTAIDGGVAIFGQACKAGNGEGTMRNDAS